MAKIVANLLYHGALIERIRQLCMARQVHHVLVRYLRLEFLSLRMNVVIFQMLMYSIGGDICRAGHACSIGNWLWTSLIRAAALIVPGFLQICAYFRIQCYCLSLLRRAASFGVGPENSVDETMTLPLEWGSWPWNNRQSRATCACICNLFTGGV